MRHSRFIAVPLAIGSAVALAACGGGGGEANNTAMNALESGFGNAADPSAVETMSNGGTPIDLSGNDANAAGNDAGAASEGNAAGAARNGM